MNDKPGKFRFTYFTDKYSETFEFYEKTLKFPLAHAWDRSKEDKGALFEAGDGLIEILHLPNSETEKTPGLDYRKPQGVFMCIQVFDIDDRFESYKSMGIPFQEKLTNQSWGHRSFSIREPNGLTLFFFQEQF